MRQRAFRRKFGRNSQRRIRERLGRYASCSELFRNDIPAVFVGSSPVAQVVCFVDHGMRLRSAGVEISSMWRNAGEILSIWSAGTSYCSK